MAAGTIREKDLVMVGTLEEPCRMWEQIGAKMKVQNEDAEMQLVAVESRVVSAFPHSGIVVWGGFG